MSVGELLIAITSFCGMNDTALDTASKARCITKLYDCVVDHNLRIQNGYVQCLKDGKWK